MSNLRAKNRSRAMSRLALLAVLLAAPILGMIDRDSGIAYAEPIARFASGSVSITLHTDDCKLKSEVSNLPRRAVWFENGKETEGCWGVIPQFGMVTFWFADKTATALPTNLFERVTGA